MYSTGIEIVTSYKAINLPYENNVSSLVSLVILFHSLSLCSWFLPLFILNSTSAWWKMNANRRSWKNTTKNLKSSVVGNFFFLFFPGGVRKDPIHLFSDWLTYTQSFLPRVFLYFQILESLNHSTSKVSISIPQTVRQEFLIILLWEFRVESNNFSPLIAGQTVSHLASQPASQLVSQPVSQPTSQPVSQPLGKLVSKSVSQQVSEPVSLPVSQSASQTASQLVGQPASQSVNQSPSQSVGEWVAKSVSRWMSRQVSHSVIQSVSQPVSRSAGQPVSQSAGQPVSRSAGQPVSRSAGQPVSQSAG